MTIKLQAVYNSYSDRINLIIVGRAVSLNDGETIFIYVV